MKTMAQSQALCSVIEGHRLWYGYRVFSIKQDNGYTTQRKSQTERNKRQKIK